MERIYGSCSSTAVFDHNLPNTNGQFLWYDTKYGASPSNPGIAWEPYDPTKPLASQKLISVKPHTDYVFSVQIRDLARDPGCVVHGAPVMGLRINGVDMAQKDLATVAGPCCPDWVQLCTPWNSGTDTTAALILESRLGIDFTDLGIDNVFFGEPTGSIAINLGNDTTICNGQSLVLKSGVTGTTYAWSDGSINPTLTVTQAGLYWLNVTQPNCSGRDSIDISLAQPPVAFSLGSDANLCDGNSLTLKPLPAPVGTYQWQDNSSKDSLVVNKSGAYSLTVTNSCGSVNDAVTITTNATPTVILPPDTILCDETSFDIAATATATSLSYKWTDGSTGPSVTATGSGIYGISVTNICGEATDNIQVTFSHSAQLPFHNSLVPACDDSVVTLNAKNPGMKFLWSTGETTQVISTLSSGTFRVTISDNDNCPVTDQATVSRHSCIVICQVAIPNAFSPNKDGNNDSFKPLFNCGVESYSLSIYNRWGEKVFESNNVADGWDGMYKGSTEPVGTYVYFTQFKLSDKQNIETKTGNVTLLR